MTTNGHDPVRDLWLADGVDVRGARTADEALARASLDWPVVHSPVLARVGVRTLSTPDRVAVVGDGKILDVVSRHVKRVDHRAFIREQLDALPHDDQIQARWHAAGCARSVVWATVRADARLTEPSTAQPLETVLMARVNHGGVRGASQRHVAVVWCGRDRDVILASEQLRDESNVSALRRCAAETLGVASRLSETLRPHELAAMVRWAIGRSTQFDADAVDAVIETFTRLPQTRLGGLLAFGDWLDWHVSPPRSAYALPRALSAMSGRRARLRVKMRVGLLAE